MKKIAVIALAVLILLSLVVLTACDRQKESGTEGDGEGTSGTDEEDEDGEDTHGADAGGNIQSRLDAGEEVLIGLAFQGLSDEFTLIQDQYLKEEFGALGFTVVSTESGSDTALMIQQIENFVTMRAVLIAVWPPDAESVMDVCTRAIDQGVYVVFTGLQTTASGYDISGGSTVSWEDLGTNMARMGLAWADIVYPDVGPGGLHVALGKFSYFSQSLLLFDAMEQTLTADPRIDITYVEDNIITLDQGFNAAENALMADPEIRMFFCFQESGAQGMSQYILSQNVDRSRYAVFTQGTAQNSADVIELSRTDESVYRGTIVYGGDENPAASLFRIACDLLFERASPPHWCILEQHSLNAFGFEV